jgi:CRP-like cAMP-binding protein
VFGSRQSIITEDDEPDNVHLILEGWAARYKVLSNRDRSIMAYLIPSDLCDVHVTLLDQMDHSIDTLSTCRIAFIPRERMNAIMCGDVQLCRALWCSILVEEAIPRVAGHDWPPPG